MNGMSKPMILILFTLIALVIVTNIFYLVKIHNMDVTNQNLNKQLNQLILSENSKLQVSIEQKQQRIQGIYKRVLDMKRLLSSTPAPKFSILPDSTLSAENQQKFIMEYQK